MEDNGTIAEPSARTDEKSAVRDYVLKSFIVGHEGSRQMIDMYGSDLGIDTGIMTRLILLKPSQRIKCGDRTSVLDFICGVFGDDNVLLRAEMCATALIAVKNTDDKRVITAIDKTGRFASRHCGCRVISVYSDAAALSELPAQYRILRKSIEYGFYNDENDIIRSIRGQANADAEIKPNYAGIETAVREGDAVKAKMLADEFFAGIERIVPPPDLAKRRCIELYVCLTRCCDASALDKYIKGIAKLEELDTLRDIRLFISGAIEEIAASNKSVPKNRYSAIINSTVNMIEENLSNENLSLRWLAGTMLFTNVDYLGKLFKKETGQNFSYYVMAHRMEKAKKLIAEGKTERIYEIAEKVGYGSNSQYFSQVFKKYTGLSPLEYKEHIRHTAE